MNEGSSWEAFTHAAWEGLDNLTPILHVNRLGQTRETMPGWDLDAYAAPARPFGWHAVIVDAIDGAFTEVAAATGEPTVLLARTAHGRGAKVVEDQPGEPRSPVPICAPLAAP